MRIVSACCTGTGLLLIWASLTSARSTRPLDVLAASPGVRRWQEDLVLAGLGRWRLWHLGVLSVVAGAVSGLFVLIVTGVAPLGFIALTVGCAVPPALVRSRARSHLRQRREAWPDAVDHVASAVRAGLSIPESLRQLAEHGPEVLRADFRAFAQHDAAHGRFDDSLDVLKRSLADPAADRLIESLRLARNVGGTDVGRLLRTLSAFLREDAATRAELAARQSWTVSAARLALAAPWLALVIVGMRGQGLEAYGTGTGVAVLVTGAVVSWTAYLLMRAIGRLPVEERVMR